MEFIFGVLVGAVLMALFMFIFIRDDKSKFEPDLIDLVKYEKSLLYAREYGKRPVPVKPIPNTSREWSDSEMQLMRDNRAKAIDLKHRLFPEQRFEDV